MMFDYSKLRGKIREKYGTEGEFAKALGISKTSLSDKLNNKVSFTSSEINKACELLDISIRFIPIYFFTPNVKETKRSE